MNNYIFLQARMGSSRLPGKTLMSLRDKPLIAHVIERLSFIEGCKTVLLTSDKPGDDVLSIWCEENGIPCFRGSEENVLQRYYEAALFYQADNILRATGDNPLVEPFFADELLKKHIDYHAEYSSNKSEIGSNLPDGLGMEIFTFDALKQSMNHSTMPHHFEHVNEYILENKSLFNIYKDCNSGGLIDRSDIHLTVDTQEDFSRMESIFMDERFSIDIDYGRLLELL